MTMQRTLGLGAVMVIAVSMIFGGLLLAPETVSADAATTIISKGLDDAAKDSYNTDLSATNFIGNLIRVLLSATGLVFLVLTVYAGILYMTAAGDESKIKKAKGMLASSVVGLIIIVGAYAITSYVIDALATASSPNTGS